MKICLHHHQSYYISVKGYLNSYHACLDIEKAVRSIDKKMKDLCHYELIDVTTFEFPGDSIVETENCELKRGDVTVFTNINIDISALTQFQISITQARKIISRYCVINLEIMV